MTTTKCAPTILLKKIQMTQTISVLAGNRQDNAVTALVNNTSVMLLAQC